MAEEKVRVKFSEIQEIFDSFLLLVDRDLVRLTLAVIIGNQLPNRKPIWLMLVAPPSSGKTTTLNTLIDLEVYNKMGDKIRPTTSISDITENGFASGMNRSDKETSLLFTMPVGGVMMFKDFTSILSKRGDSKTVVMGQLREIYDGAYSKRTGNGESVNWRGKIGAIAGVTEAIYQHLESMSVMGDRFMLYQIPQPDRKDMIRFKLTQEKSGKTESAQMPIAQALVHQYMQQAFDALTDVKIELDEETENDIIDVADFCTMVRSGIIIDDFTGNILFVPQPEMPARMFDQMLAIAASLLLMEQIDNPNKKVDGHLAEKDKKLMYKIAYDSIPIVRRIALEHLARYKNGVDTAGLATKTNYPTKVVAAWLEQLNALGIVTRSKSHVGANRWVLKPEYKKIMFKLQGIRDTEDILTEGVADEDAANAAWEADKKRGVPDQGTLDEIIENNDGNW